jgi:hypothetical protein
MLEKEKTARINNEHFTSVLILKEIVTYSNIIDHPLLQRSTMAKIK